MMLLAQFSGPVNYYVAAGTVVLACWLMARFPCSGDSGRAPNPPGFARETLVCPTALSDGFCIPLLGYLIVPAIYYWMRKYPPVVEHAFQDISAIMPSMFEQRSHTGRIAFAGAGIRYQLSAKKAHPMKNSRY